MSLSSLSAFVVVALVVVAVPGPSVLFVVGRALTLGRRGALTTALGNAIGTLVQVIAVAVGIGALVERSVLAFTVLKFAGAAYLVFLGVQAFRHRRAFAVETTVAAGPTRVGRVLREGFLVGLTNPKTTVFFAAALPPFVDPAVGSVPLQMLLLGVVFLGIALVTDSIWATGAGAARGWLARSPRRIEGIGAVSGLVMIGLGVRVALTGRPS
ncbi:LysE family translocator [Aquipuribacter hungaricus]|uniref:LysE family translocator n=1 Tax=Aquipuribacter hungaricus TaxID=545624 RepID=A0ABV7WMV5_9MICO